MRRLRCRTIEAYRFISKIKMSEDIYLSVGSLQLYKRRSILVIRKFVSVSCLVMNKLIAV